MKMKSVPEYLTINETAQFLRVSRSTIERRIRDGRLPVSKHGKPYRVLRDELKMDVSEESSRGVEEE